MSGHGDEGVVFSLCLCLLSLAQFGESQPHEPISLLLIPTLLLWGCSHGWFVVVWVGALSHAAAPLCVPGCSGKAVHPVLSLPKSGQHCRGCPTSASV